MRICTCPVLMQGAQIRKHINGTLGSGNLREAVKLPTGADLNEWLVVMFEGWKLIRPLLGVFFSFLLSFLIFIFCFLVFSVLFIAAPFDMLSCLESLHSIHISYDIFGSYLQ